MKLIILTLSFFASYTLSAQTNWSLANSGIPTDFYTRDFIKDGSAELYAIGSDNEAGIYKTTDNGLNWSYHNVVGLTNHDGSYNAGVNTGSKYLINALTNITNNAIYSSTDMINWSLSNTGIPSSFYTNDFAVKNSNEIYAIGANYNGSIFVPAVYYSTDGGSTWSELSTVGLSAHDWIYTASIYVNNKILMNANATLPSSNAIYSSLDGENWNTSNNGIPNDFETLDFILIDNNNIWAVGGVFGSTWTAGMYTSIDGGVNWSLGTNTGMENHDFQYAGSKAFNNYLFCSASAGGSGTAIYRTSNTVSINENENIANRKIIKVIDIMGRETTPQKNKVLIYVYSDGTTERIFEFE